MLITVIFALHLLKIVEEGYNFSPFVMAAARKQDKTLWRTMRVHSSNLSTQATRGLLCHLLAPDAQAGNAKKMYSWNTVRKLKMDDDTHTPEESCKMYIKHDLSENPDGFFNHAHVHANALRELFTSSGFSKKVMLQQLCAFFATIRNDDDEAIRIIEPSDKMLGPPILMIAVEEMAVADGSMFKFLIEEKVSASRHSTVSVHRPIQLQS